MGNENTRRTGLGHALLTHRLARVGEIVTVFTAAAAVIFLALPLAGENLLARQGVLLAANVLMLFLVWLGLRLRGQGVEHFGLRFRGASRGVVIRAVLQSVAVFVVAVAAFVVGAIVMVNIVGRPESADMSAYDFLRGNLPMLVFCLVGVWIISSFGEEFIYRGFLIHRIAELGSGGSRAWKLAVVASSVVFGLAHYGWGPAGMVQTTFMGLALGVSYLVVGRNLWVVILAHGYMDTILMLQMYFAAAPVAGD